MTPQLIEDLKRDEGLRLAAYRDTVGVWTIGYGHAHVAPGTRWTAARALAQLEADVAAVVRGLDEALPWWRGLDDARQDALAQMAFNLGLGGLLAFHGFLAALRAGDWPGAREAMLASAWARQVHGRATRLAALIASGRRPDPPSIPSPPAQ